MTALLVNGEPVNALPADDRGLLYGDGLFETVGFHNGRPALWDLHMARLRRGCAALGLPEPNAALLFEEGQAVSSGSARCAVRFTLTRGSGGRAYIPPKFAEPNRIVMRRELSADLDEQRRGGIDLITVHADLPTFGPLDGHKHLNRLPQVLIGARCREAGVPEALIIDSSGRWIEALTGNLIVDRSGRLIEPIPHPAALDGVGLAWLRSVAGTSLERAVFGPDQLQTGDAIWVLNSVLGIRPVARLDGVKRPLGTTLSAWQRRWIDTVET